MPPGRRPERVAEAMREVISELLLREVKDPRIGMVTVTRVDVSPDLRHAKVYFSSAGDSDSRNKTLIGLNRAAGFLRSQLTKQLNLRYAPEVRFIRDTSLDDAGRLAQVLREATPPAPTSQAGDDEADTDE
ncbi:MAG TPA: 30S ribosome-binding factor RbfA [Terriglobales bacterium]|nr:30S ribosome-binding factor RbfA [Terriglobales bacterium]